MKRAAFVTFIVLFLFAGFLFYSAHAGTKPASVNHRATWEQVEQMRSAYTGEIKARIWDNNQVKELVNLKGAEKFIASYAVVNGKETLVLTVADKNGNEIKDFGLEYALGCPPYCFPITNKVASK